MLKLIVGNKKYSSWSMRPWVALKHAGAPFEEQVIGLDLPDTATNIARVNPAGRVPALYDDGLLVWDSLAICEYLAEKLPAAQLWPADVRARAQARSACAEMHSSFQALRTDFPMKLVTEKLSTPAIRPEVAADIARITALWTELRQRYGQGGPFLFGRFGIADAYFAPVAVGRFLAYGLRLEGAVKDYVDAVAAQPAVKAWVDAARQETIRVRRYE